MSATETEVAAAELAAKRSSLATALVGALAELTVIERGRTAKIETKGGGSYSYSFADLGDVVAATRPVLARHGLVALSPVSGRDGGLQVQVILLHTSGERIAFDPLYFNASNDPQAVGSTITYYRRYALLAALGVATGEDDDGHRASVAARFVPEPVRLPLHPNKIESLRKRCAEIEASVAEIVRTATGGRTTDPAECFQDEAEAIAAALEEATPADA